MSSILFVVVSTYFSVSAEPVLPSQSSSVTVPPFAANLAKAERTDQEQKMSDEMRQIMQDVVKGDRRTLNKHARRLAQSPAKLDQFMKVFPSQVQAVQMEVPYKKVASERILSAVNAVYHDPCLTKKKVTLSVRDAHVHDVIELVGKSIGINFVIDSQVEGVVQSLNLSDVKASTAMRIICSNNSPQLGLLHDEDVWRIAPLSHVKTCIQERLVHDTLLDFRHAVCAMRHVRWTETFKNQAYNMWECLNAQHHHKHHYLVIDDETKKLFFGGCMSVIKQFKRYLKEIDVRIPQVSIEARVVVADKQFEESFGLQWSGIYNRKSSVCSGFQFVGAGGQLSDFSNDAPVFSDLMDWALNLFPTAWEKARNFHVPLIFGGKDLNSRRLNLVLNAAENKNEIKTILKPSILTNDKETAEVLEGEVIPIETIVEESVEGRLRNVRTATYKDVGIQLKVCPLVSANKKSVILDIFVENSMVQENGSSGGSTSSLYPTIITTRTKTMVMLASGQTTMISGLIKNRNTRENFGFPFLSKIPILGLLFKGYRKTAKDLQLLIFITPTVI